MQSHTQMELAIKQADHQIETAESIEASEAAYDLYHDTTDRALRAPATTAADLAAKLRIFADKFDYSDPIAKVELQADLASIIADATRLSAS